MCLMTITTPNWQPPDSSAHSGLHRLVAGVVSIVLCLMGGWANYLLIVFSSLKRGQVDAWVQSGNAERERRGSVLLSFFQIYHLLLTLLYSIQYLAIASVPIVLVYVWSVGYAFSIAAFLVVVMVYLLPRMYLSPGNYEEKASHYAGLVRAVHCLNQAIPLNGLIKRLICSDKDEGEVIINRQNIFSLLYLHKPLHYGYRQEQLQLLQKLLKLRERSVDSLMVERRHIFTLDVQSSITQKLLYKLGRFVFSKILVSQDGEDNVIGYMHFKKLLYFNTEAKDTIADHRKEVIDSNIALVSHTSSLFQALNAMLQQRVNFALVYREGRLVGLVKLKDIFAGMLLNWYNYEGLSAQRSYEYFTTQCARPKTLASLEPLLEAEQQI